MVRSVVSGGAYAYPTYSGRAVCVSGDAYAYPTYNGRAVCVSGKA